MKEYNIAPVHVAPPAAGEQPIDIAVIERTAGGERTVVVCSAGDARRIVAALRLYDEAVMEWSGNR